MAYYEQIGTDTPDGLIVGGLTTNKIGFFGATPVVRQTAITAATDLTTALVSITALIAELKNLGLTA